ncbi:MAG: hypothetical protein OXM01_03170, partial [Gemmatimonadota bacterium]|nr:hypothetical protein [Gemmatimonadota bacterium]
SKVEAVRQQGVGGGIMATETDSSPQGRARDIADAWLDGLDVTESGLRNMDGFQAATRMREDGLIPDDIWLDADAMLALRRKVNDRRLLAGLGAGPPGTHPDHPPPGTVRPPRDATEPEFAEIVDATLIEVGRQAGDLGGDKKLRDSDVKIDIVVEKVIAGFVNEGRQMAAWREGGSMHDAWLTFTENYVKQDYNTVQFMINYEKARNYFATIIDIVEKDGRKQFNCYVYDRTEKTWTPRAAAVIIADMHALKDTLDAKTGATFEYRITRDNGLESAGQLAAAYAHQIRRNGDRYGAARRSRWHMPNGKVWDFEMTPNEENGLDRIRDVQPGSQDDFTTELDSNTPFEAEGVTELDLKEAEAKYVRIGTERFGGESAFLRYDDHKAGVILATSLLKEPRFMLILGDINRYKSPLNLLFTWVVGGARCVKIKPKELGNDMFLPARCGNMSYAYFEELPYDFFIRDPKGIDDMVTEEDSTTPRNMNSTSTHKTWRNPRYSASANDLGPLGSDVKHQSKYKRLEVAEAQPVTEKTENLYDAFQYDTVMHMALQRRWLRRATEIYHGADMHTATEEETKEALEEYVMRDAIKFFAEGGLLERETGGDIAVKSTDARRMYERLAHMKVSAGRWKTDIVPQAGYRITKSRCMEVGITTVEGIEMSTYRIDKSPKVDADGTYAGETIDVLRGFKWAGTVIAEPESDRDPQQRF